MSIISGREIPNTDCTYSMFFDQPPRARGNMYTYEATLVTLVHAAHVSASPILSAWGKSEFDAQENLEGKIREWLVDH